jgi:hypothetical protein
MHMNQPRHHGRKHLRVIHGQLIEDRWTMPLPSLLDIVQELSRQRAMHRRRTRMIAHQPKRLAIVLG